MGQALNTLSLALSSKNSETGWKLKSPDQGKFDLPAYLTIGAGALIFVYGIKYTADPIPGLNPKEE
jgi:hypothetical protein